MIKRLLQEALVQGKSIVPLLVDGGQMPPQTGLPAGLRDLAYYQALTVESRQALPRLITQVLATSTRASILDNRRGEQRSAFVSYRRDDSGYWADVLARALALRLGPKSIFIDVGSEQPGSDYRAQISNALADATDVVVVIGPGFLEPAANGVRRIDRADDQLRSEIRTALRGKKRMHVVLTGRARVPARAELPHDIAALADVKSVHRLDSDLQADRVVHEVFPRPDASRSLGPVDSFWAEREAERLSFQRHTESILAELATHGWTNVSKCFGESTRSTIFTITNDRFGVFRLKLYEFAGDLTCKTIVCLEERIVSYLRAGLGKWVTRRATEVSPIEASSTEVMRLPDWLLEVALDPGQHLDRWGRRRVRFKANQRWIEKNLPLHLYSNIVASRSFEHKSEVDAEVIEEYQQTRRRIAARGGLKGLHPIATLRLGTGDARGIAFHPKGQWLAVATNSGAVLVRTRDWQTDAVLDSPAAWRAAAFSRGGWLTLGSRRGQLSIWDRNGSLMADRIVPYQSRSLLRRIWERPGRHSLSDPRAITTISWSPTGEAVACCGGEAAWVYRPATGEVRHWTLPKLVPPLLEYNSGAHFIAGEEALVVYGFGSFFCVLRLPNLEVRSVVQQQNPLNKKQIAKETHAISGGTPFSNINCVEPNPRGDVLACAGEYGQIGLYKLPSLELSAKTTWFEPVRRGMQADVAVVSFSPNGRLLAAISSEQRLVVGDATTLEPKYESPEVMEFVLGGDYTPTLAWSSDSSLIAVNHPPHFTQVWAT